MTYLDWIEHVVWRRGRRRQMVDLIHVQVQGIDNVMVDHVKVGVAHPVFKVPLGASEKVVCHYHFVTLRTKY